MLSSKSSSANLDFLRTVAVLSVTLAHSMEAGSYLGVSNLPRVGSLGRMGVLLFFVHTSLVLMMSLDRTRATGWALAANFYLRRSFRIYPLSMACVLIVLLLQVPASFGGVFAQPGTFTLVSNLLNIQNLTYQPNVLGPLWSLPLEVQMYVFLPGLFLLFSRFRRFTWLLMPLVWLGAIGVALAQPKISGRLDVAQYAPCFLPGVFAFFLPIGEVRRLPAWIWPLVVLGSIWIFGPFDDHSLPDKRWRAWTVCLLIGLLVPFFQDLSSPRLNRVTHEICKYSYGIYLAHEIIFWFCFRRLADYPAGAQLVLAACLLFTVPVIAYHGLEKPLIDLGSRVASRLSRSR